MTLASPGSVVIRTWSYAGGLNAAGTTIPRGGFDPTLSLFDGSGNLVASNRDGGCGSVPADQVTSFCWDAYIQQTLPAGTYRIALTQSENTPDGPTLADSFPYAGQGNFTAIPGAGPDQGFWDLSYNQRTAPFALDISGVTQASAADLAITTIALPNSLVNISLTTQLSASGGLPPYTWTLGPGGAPAGSGLILSSGGTLTGTPAVPGSFTIPVRVTDALAQTSERTIQLPVFAPLSIFIATLPDGTVGTAYSSAAFSSSGGTGSVTWLLTSGTLPPGLNLIPGPASLTISGTPSAAGTFAFSVQATDGLTTGSFGVSLRVKSGLSLSTSVLPGATRGQSYGPFQLSAAGASGSPRWSANGLPAGLTLSSSGQVSGTPTASGTFSNISVTVTDASGTTATGILSITVIAPPLSITLPAGLPSAVASRGTISGAFAANGGTPPFVWSATGLPPGVSLSGSGALSGAPGSPGIYDFTIQVTDSQNLTNSVAITLVVVGLTSSNLPGATVGLPYSQTLSAVGASAFSATGLPGGLLLSGAGTLNGTPSGAGTFTFTVTVTGNGVSSSTTLTLTVSTGTFPLNISGIVLPGGTVQTVYSGALSASGGTPPYAWAILGGSLPPGVTLTAESGTLSGTAASAGAFPFTAEATDSKGAKFSAAANITIAPQQLGLETSLFPNGVAGVGYPPQVISGTGGISPYTATITGNLPTGLTLSNGTIGGLPTTPGTFSFTLAITDSNNPTTTISVPARITINPNSRAELILSHAAVSYRISRGAAAATLPDATSVTVASGAAAQPLGYAVSVVPPAPWLTVTGGSNTPGSISLALNSNALSLPAGSYAAAVLVTCVAPGLCAGTSQTIEVSLSVDAPPPALGLTNSLLSFTSTPSNNTPAAIPAAQTLGIQNVGGGSLTILAVTPEDAWISISGVPAALPSGSATQLTVRVNPRDLVPGYYLSRILVATSAGTQTVQVGFLIAAGATMTLSASGTQLNVQAGDSRASPGGSFTVGVTANASWQASVPGGEGWLNLQATSGASTPEQPGALTFSVNASAATLSAGTYFATIRIAAASVVNSPLHYVVALTVTDPAVPVTADLAPAGLIFVSNAQTDPASQALKLSVASATPVAYQTSARTVDGANWLSVSPASGTASSSAPGVSNVAVSTASLTPGTYHGGVSYATSSGVVRTVSVDLIVAAAGASGGGCIPSRLTATQTGLVDDFFLPAALPAALALKVVNNCGGAVTNAYVNATFSNGDAPIALPAVSSVSGTYSGTWTPVNPSSRVWVIATVAADGLGTATARIQGQVTKSGLPQLTRNSTTNFAAPVIGGAVAPGTIVQLYGSNLANTATAAIALPLPTSLNGTSVTIGGIPAPLFYAGPGQINAQVPFELAPGRQYQIVVNAGGALTAPDNIQIAPVSPGIAANPGGYAIAQHALNYAVVTTAAPAKPGEFIVLYLSGLGVTDPAVTGGSASPSDPLAKPLVAPALTLDGAEVPVAFAGLTPGAAGLYQIVFQIPAGTPNGNFAVVVSQGGARSNQVILPVQSN